MAPCVGASTRGNGRLSSGGARRGAGGSLHRQSATAGSNSPPRSGFSGRVGVEGVEGRDLRSPGLRTPSGPEGSSGKEKARGCRSHPGRSSNPRRRWEAEIDAGCAATPHCPCPPRLDRLTYQTLYRKYRSQTFADLVGQEATRRALQGAIASDRVSHAYLFSGTRGTGKTSTARLLAKAVNCLRRAPGESEPCNECESCVQVQNGSALDLIEIDAASNRGIDEIRDLREKVNLAPAVGRRKVYIIDEAHMLTAEAFNALLKTLEEPPAHVMFILCTTESNKVPLTVLGRCQQFVFRRFSVDQIGARLAFISEREGIVVEPEALVVIARVAQGSMRDAIGLLDQLVPLADGPITMAGAREVLGVADPDRLRALLDLVLAGRPSEALEVLAGISEGGGELRQVVRGVMERCRGLLIAAIEGQDASGRTRLSAVLDALLHLDGEVRRHAEPRFLVEATLVRLAVETPAPAALASPPSGSQPSAPAPATPSAPS